MGSADSAADFADSAKVDKMGSTDSIATVDAMAANEAATAGGDDMAHETPAVEPAIASGITAEDLFELFDERLPEILPRPSHPHETGGGMPMHTAGPDELAAQLQNALGVPLAPLDPPPVSHGGHLVGIHASHPSLASAYAYMPPHYA